MSRRYVKKKENNDDYITDVVEVNMNEMGENKPSIKNVVTDEIIEPSLVIKELKLRNKRLDILFKKKKKFLRRGYELANFKEPILQLIRRDKSVEFYENVKPGMYELRHSDKDVGDIKVNLPSSYLLRFPYGPKQFRGFIQSEDEFMPYPHDVLLSAESVRILIDKTLNDVKKWKAEELRAKGDMWWKIAIGIAVIICAYVMAKLVLPDVVPDIIPPKPVVDAGVDAVKDGVSNVARNVTVIIRNGTG